MTDDERRERREAGGRGRCRLYANTAAYCPLSLSDRCASIQSSFTSSAAVACFSGTHSITRRIIRRNISRSSASPFFHVVSTVSYVRAVGTEMPQSNFPSALENLLLTVHRSAISGGGGPRRDMMLARWALPRSWWLSGSSYANRWPPLGLPGTGPRPCSRCSKCRSGTTRGSATSSRVSGTRPAGHRRC